MTDRPSPMGSLTRPKAAIMLIVAAVLLPVLVFGISRSLIGLVLLTVLEAVAAGAIVVAAGGYGAVLLRPLLGTESGGGLRAVTAAAVGLWLFSVALMLVGSVIPGSLALWVWWPVVAVGVVLAAWQGRKVLEGWKLPGSYDGRFVAWIAVALAGGLWAAGASQPVGRWQQLPESREILYRQMQLPAEFHHAGRVEAVEHNCYSYGPMGMEMLFLLGMVLRGGSLEGMYLARYLSIATAALAMLGVYLSLSKDASLRGRVAVVLLVTTPIVMRLGWLARPDLVQLSMLTLALLWLRQWMRNGSWRAAACAGALLGFACSTGYDAAWLIAAPAMAVMVIAAALRPQRLPHVAAALLAGVVMVAPWLIRTAVVADGNPLFPRATQSLGRAHWSPDEQQRWLSAQSIPPGDPVPVPPGYEPADPPTRLELLHRNLIAYSAAEKLGVVTLAIALVSLCALLAMRKPDGWDWMLVGTAVAMVTAWVFGTPAMWASRIAPVMVPVCLLAAGGLAKLARVESNPFSRRATRPASGPWGEAAVAAVGAAAVLVNVIVAYGVFQSVVIRLEPPGSMMAAAQTTDQPDRQPLLLIGSMTPFYAPAGTLYSTPFDDNPLAAMAEAGKTGPEMIAALQTAGVARIVVFWKELWTQTGLYGGPKILSWELLDRARDGKVAGLSLLGELSASGLQLDYSWPEGAETQPALRPATMPTTAATTQPWRGGSFPAVWPVLSTYALPAPETQAATVPASD